jgi:cytochrome c553
MRILTIAALLIGGCASTPGQQLVLSAAQYRQFERVDDIPRAAPTMCKAPVDLPRVSASRDEATHGRKLYYLYAKDRLAYLHAKELDQPDGQVVVKESWYPRVVEGRSWSEQTKGPLYIMLKSGGEWTYATATPDGKEITASGKLASCIDCHESDRTRDRMFGLTSCPAAK